MFSETGTSWRMSPPVSRAISGRRNDADGGEGVRQVPAVVEDAHLAVLAGTLLRRDAHQPVERVLAHGLVRAQGHQIVQRGSGGAQLLVEDAEEERAGAPFASRRE